MQKWEYKIMDGQPTEHQINQLGEDRWELIAITSPNKMNGAVEGNYSKTVHIALAGERMYFKRPKS